MCSAMLIRRGVAEIEAPPRVHDETGVEGRVVVG